MFRLLQTPYSHSVLRMLGYVMRAQRGLKVCTRLNSERIARLASPGPDLAEAANPYQRPEARGEARALSHVDGKDLEPLAGPSDRGAAKYSVGTYSTFEYTFQIPCE